MLVYHFINKEFGIEDMRKRRLKIAMLNELNDPFEFFGINLGDKAIRHAFRKMKNELSTTRGLLCFSRDWHNPVQWSHYAEKHQGLCMGFEVPDKHLGPVKYSPKRLPVEPEQLINYRQLDPETLTTLLFSKYSHWKYENEFRSFVTLEDKDTEKNMYFAEFSDDLKLVQVIVGAESTISREDIRVALGDLTPQVDTFKARLAFKSFRVIKQMNQKLWV